QLCGAPLGAKAPGCAGNFLQSHPRWGLLFVFLFAGTFWSGGLLFGPPAEKLAKLRLQAEADAGPLALAVKDSRLFTQLAAELLSEGTPVRFRAEGQSMTPSLEGGELLTVAPLGERTLEQGQIVFARTNGAVIAHRIVAKADENSQFELQ